MSAHGISCPHCGRCDIGGCRHVKRWLAEQIPARVVGGPIEMRDYEYLRLAVDHDVVLPDGSELILPAGSTLIMKVRGGSVHQEGGIANRNERLDGVTDA